MGTKLQLFYYDYCPFCQNVLRTIKKLNIKIEYCNTMDNPSFEQKLVQDTGRRTVPCLYINDRPMHESSDIIKWLEDNIEILDKQ